jgi:hypothetical protein
MRYLLSLPERLIRAGAAALGGLLYETAQVTLPAWVRKTRFYQAVVARFLRITIEYVGDVRNTLPPDEIGAQELALRKAAGNVIEVAGFLALGWSPLWLLAAAADLTGGTRQYLKVLVADLKGNGLLSADIDVTSVEQLLAALEGTSGVVAEAVDVPPLNVNALRRSWRTLKANAADLPDAGSLAQVYTQLTHIARAEGRSVGAVSGIIALSAMRAGIRLGQIHVFEHYRDSIRGIRTEGLAAYTRRVTRPYLAAAADHLDAQRETNTERFIERLRRRRPN